MTLLQNIKEKILRLGVNSIPRMPFREDYIFGTLYLLFLAVPLVFVPVIDEGFETPKMALYLICLGAAIILFAWQKRSLLLPTKYLSILSGIFGLLIIFSVVTSLDYNNAIFGLVGRSSNSAIFFLSWLILFVILNSVLTKSKLLAFLRMIIFGGVLIALYSILQYQGIGFYSGMRLESRLLVPSLLGNPNFNAMYLATILPVVLYFASIRPKLASRGLYLLVSMLMVWAIAQSGSRAAMLGVVIGVIIQIGLSLYVKADKRAIVYGFLVLMVSVVVSLAAISVYRPNNLQETLKLDEYTQQSRFLVWDMSIDMITRHSLLGVGFSNYFIEFNQMGWSPFSYGERFDDPHNVLLMLGVSGGVPLLAVFILLISSIIYIGLKKLKENPINSALLSGVGAWFVCAMFGPVVVACWLLLVLFLAGLIYSYGSNTYSVEQKIWSRTIILLLGAVIVATGVVFIGNRLLVNFSRVAFDKGQYQKSIKLAEWGQVWDVSNSRVESYLLKSRIALGLPADETEKLMLEGLSQRKNSSPSYVSAANMYYHLWKQTGDNVYLEKMDKMMQEALAREPGYSGLYVKLAYLSYKSGQIDQALALQKLSVTYYDSEFFNWVLLAKLYYEKGLKDQFIYTYSKAAGMNKEEFLLKNTLKAFKDAKDIKELPFPVYFPEPN